MQISLALSLTRHRRYGQSKELDHERATLFEQAKEEALRRATQAVEDLNALGLKYRLIEDASPAGSKDVGKTQHKGQAEKKMTGRLPG